MAPTASKRAGHGIACSGWDPVRAASETRCLPRDANFQRSFTHLCYQGRLASLWPHTPQAGSPTLLSLSLLPLSGGRASRMVSEAPTSSEIPWGSVPGDPEPVGSGKEHCPGTYNESWFCRIPFLFIGVFPFSAVPTPSLPSHRQPFWRALGGSSCPRVFFCEMHIVILHVCIFSVRQWNFHPSTGFCKQPYCCGCIWCVASHCSQPHGSHTLALSLQSPREN